MEDGGGTCEVATSEMLCSVLLPESFSYTSMVDVRLAPSAPAERDSPEAPSAPCFKQQSSIQDASTG
ncbi:hypothetical protein EGYY_27280 [Eggerthella sp. YY7918]|nr:hypothetical protein EGYY_27280 [Eggerthella sp. YY7918]